MTDMSGFSAISDISAAYIIVRSGSTSERGSAAFGRRHRRGYTSLGYFRLAQIWCCQELFNMVSNLNAGELFSVKGRVALITGGTSGIGFMIASVRIKVGV